jgi:hypothetical protein
MPGISVCTGPRPLARPWFVTCALVFAFIVGGVACKQDVNERCETDLDCADPELNYCKGVDRATLNGGICRPRTDMATTTIDAGPGTDAGAGAPEASVEAGEVAGTSEGGTEVTLEAGGDAVPAADGAGETAETSAGDAPAEAPAVEVAPEVAADLAGDGG